MCGWMLNAFFLQWDVRVLRAYPKAMNEASKAHERPTIDKPSIYKSKHVTPHQNISKHIKTHPPWINEASETHKHVTQNDDFRPLTL